MRSAKEKPLTVLRLSPTQFYVLFYGLADNRLAGCESIRRERTSKSYRFPLKETTILFSHVRTQRLCDNILIMNNDSIDSLCLPKCIPGSKMLDDNDPILFTHAANVGHALGNALGNDNIGPGFDRVREQYWAKIGATRTCSDAHH